MICLIGRQNCRAEEIRRRPRLVGNTPDDSDLLRLHGGNRFRGRALLLLVGFLLLARRLEESFQSGNRGLRDLDWYVRIPARGGQLRVAKYRLDDERISTLDVEQRAAAMARVVKTDRRHLRSTTQRVKGLADIPLV